MCIRDRVERSRSRGTTRSRKRARKGTASGFLRSRTYALSKRLCAVPLSALSLSVCSATVGNAPAISGSAGIPCRRGRQALSNAAHRTTGGVRAVRDARATAHAICSASRASRTRQGAAYQRATHQSATRAEQEKPIYRRLSYHGRQIQQKQKSKR